jgi:hypothetical protein
VCVIDYRRDISRGRDVSGGKASAVMGHSVENVESLLKRLERPGWTWIPARCGLWNEERQLLVTAERIREELEAALTQGFVEAVISGLEAQTHRGRSSPAWLPPPLPAADGSRLTAWYMRGERRPLPGSAPVQPAQQDVRVAGEVGRTSAAQVVAAQGLEEVRIGAQSGVEPALVLAQRPVA